MSYELPGSIAPMLREVYLVVISHGSSAALRRARIKSYDKVLLVGNVQ
jgi:hypothetical protein